MAIVCKYLIYLIATLLQIICTDSRIFSKKLLDRHYLASFHLDGELSNFQFHTRIRPDIEKFSNIQLTKRSAADELKTHEFALPGTQRSHLTFHWTGKGSNAVFVLTVKRATAPVPIFQRHRNKYVSSSLFRSRDYGETFHRLTKGLEDAQLIYVYPSRLNSNKVVGVSEMSHKMLLSTDQGDSWSTTTVEFHVFYIEFHPHLEDYMLNFDLRASSLHVSPDFGKNWFLLHERATYHFFWAVPNVDADNTTVHFEYQDDRGATFYKACAYPYCKDVSPDKSLGEIEPLSLIPDNEYIFIQKKDMEDTSNMLVSYNRSGFYEVLLPNNLEADDAEILSTDDGMVLLSATDGEQHNLYMSDESGRYFVTSLRNIFVVFGLSYHFVDRFEVLGSRGTFIVNQYTTSEQIVTLITFNKGVTWVPIKSPDSSCSLSSDCSLHFHLYAKVITINLNLMAAEREAPGLIFMHGSSGRSLPSQSHKSRSTTGLSSYMSRDGGITWKKLFKGIHNFNILDHGAAIVAMANPRSNKSYTIKYSCTEGDQWETHAFTKKPMHVTDITTEPGMTSLIVNIIGRDSENGDWRIIKVNFKDLLSRQCNDSDYETWSPKAIYSHTEKPTHCIVGSKYSYKRRKSNAQCFNGRDYDSPITSTPCTCTYSDYYCSYGYEGKLCHVAKWYNPIILTRDCPKTYVLPNAHRKIAGDVCTGGGAIASDPAYKVTTKQCPVTVPENLELRPVSPVVATHENVTFTLSQQWGTKDTTLYTFDYGDNSTKRRLKGLDSAQYSWHLYTSAGIYHVTAGAINDAGSTTASCIVTVEDSIEELDIDLPMGAPLNNLTQLHATPGGRPGHTANLSSVHYVWTFHPQTHLFDAPRILTWNNTVSHTFITIGWHHITLQAMNGVGIRYKEIKVYVHEFARFVKLTFPTYMNDLSRYTRLVWQKSFERLLIDAILEITDDDGERLEITVSFAKPVYGLVTIIGSSSNDPFMDKTANTIIAAVKSPGIELIYPHSNLRVRITNASIITYESPASHKTAWGMIGVYVAIPVLLIAVIAIGLVLLYYRRKLRTIRRYALLQSNDEEENHLLGASDEDDEPPLDMNPRPVNDDDLLDDHVTGIPGNRPALVLMTNRSTSRDNTESV